MAVPVLTAKLYIPPPPPKVVTRPRLIGRLNEGLHFTPGVTLVSAPAGFGKTTLISEWIASKNLPVAWLSLDQNDNDPARFLIYLTSALQTISPTLGVEVLEALQASQAPALESVLTVLLNEITALPNGLILVLDDYHLIDSKLVDQALAFLVEHLPPQLHLVLTTREDPTLPLSRLRARRQLVELRASDLRFTPTEAADFLNQVMSLNLLPEQVAALETRTEGWIAGLQLAALSMKDNRDVAEFIQAFAGDHRYIVDYLVEEVLQRQPESIRSFLLQTAILDRLTGSLCDAVTGQTDGNTRLEDLQRGNFFIIPLDDKRQWYRYHHLFADVLRMHLSKEQPNLISTLHQCASAWYEQNGSLGDAIHHGLAARDFERAAGLIERAAPVMRQSRQESTLLGWLKALPAELLQDHPVLNVNFVGTLLQNGQFEGVESRLREIEQWLAAADDIRRPAIYVDEDDFQRLPASVAMYHAAIALARGDVANTMTYAQQVIELARDDDDFLKGAASSILGLALWTSGDLEAAYQTYAAGMTYLHKAGYISDVIGGSITLADIRLTQGRLREALNIYQRGLQLATKPDGPALRGAADMYIGLSELYRERNNLEAALQYLQQSKALGELNGLPKSPYRWRVAMARIREAQGDLDSALDLLVEAERVYVGDFSPNVRPIVALKARLWLEQGRLGEALAWVRAQGLSSEDTLSYLREFEHITLARVLLAQYQHTQADSTIRDAIGLLNRLLNAAEEGGRLQAVIEILIVRALAKQMLGDISAAIDSLEKALTLAEPERYVRFFLDEGVPMARLLQEAAARKILPGYTAQLLTSSEAQGQQNTSIAPNNTTTASQSLIEPLSQRELELLRLLKTDLSGPEIASELVIALSTVRTHTKRIYDKLNVKTRRAAVKRGEELGLI